MAIRSLLLGMAFGSILPPAAQAQTATVQEMISGCEAAAVNRRSGDWEVDEDANFCLGIAAGVSQVMWFNCSTRELGALPVPGLSASMPPSNGAAAQAWVNWARANPSRWGDDFILSLIDVMAETFPCPH